ncbi:spore germination protein [Bacillus cereus]|uniref:Spore germination protein n=1 Tax=Bacillus cereus TaxID=1396 RepID=A0A2A9A317_BACCE|nr:spore germination protein [Bacillus cereus]
MPKNTKISEKLSINVTFIYEIFSQTPDLVVRHFKISGDQQDATLVYLESLSDIDIIHNHILTPLLCGEGTIDNLNSFVSVGRVQQLNDWSIIQDSILQGNSILFIEGSHYVLLFGTQGGPKRTIEESHIEASLKSGHESFVESKNDNIALIRSYIQNSNLKIKEIIVGNRGKNKVSILYLRDLACTEVLKKLETRIQQVKADYILNAGELKELIEDDSYSPFPQFISTERPDTVASYIFRGHFAILVDKSPSVLIAPVSFTSFFQNIDDYSIGLITSNFIRFLRYFAFFVAISLPAIYISLVSFNYEMIPLQLLLTIGKYRADVPFPPLIEALIMEISLEMLRESAIRLPAAIGQTVGVVGAIVIGQAAVQAGIVSNMMIIIVASTAIASFIIPNYDMGSAIRLIRFPMMLLASLFGIVGIVIGLMTLIGHLLSLESLGIPYSQASNSFKINYYKDSIFRFHLKELRKHSKRSKIK